MTAIAGIWTRDANPQAAERCGRMLSALAMYGTDRCDQSNAPEICVGRCLSRRLPEDAFDRQPVIRGERTLVADVRLDNREELVAELALSREQCREWADVAILFAALERWQDAATDHVVGDYAFALWDRGRQRLALVRDPLGHRPLYFHRAPHFLAFASMPKGLHAVPEVPFAPDLARVAARIGGIRHGGPRSFYAGIERVEPGQRVTVSRERIDRTLHWQPRRRTLRLRQPEDYAAGLREVLDRAVGACLRGVGDVGTQLSGGLDSTSVTVTAARLQAVRQRRVTAFTAAPRAGYAVPALRRRFGDETAHAAAAAAGYDNIDHVILRAEARDPLDACDAWIRFYDRPPLNACNVAWIDAIYAAAAAQGLRVMLVGNCGNATISYHGRHLFAELFARGRLGQWWRAARALHGQGGDSWRGIASLTVAHRLSRTALARLRRWRSGTGEALRRAPWTASGAQRFGRQRSADDHEAPDAWEYRMAWLRQLDPGDDYLGLLAASGVECRDPTGDQRVVEFCLAVPTEQYLRDGVPAALLRRAMRDRLPPIVLEERRRGLQAVDWHESVTQARSGLLAEIEALSACEPIGALLDANRLRALVRDWPSDGWERPETAHLYRDILLRSLTAGRFARRVLAGRDL